MVLYVQHVMFADNHYCHTLLFAFLIYLEQHLETHIK